MIRISVSTKLIRANHRSVNSKISKFRPIFPMILSISTLQSNSVLVSRNTCPVITNVAILSLVFFPKDETISSVTTGNRETPQGASNVTVCTEMNAPENKLFHCQRNWIRRREMTYIDLKEVGIIKAVSIYTRGNRQVRATWWRVLQFLLLLLLQIADGLLFRSTVTS